MKDSGVEWIGEIPEEWSKDKICRVCNLIGSGTTPKFDRFDLSSAEIPWIQSGDLSAAHLHEVKTYVTQDIIAGCSALKVYEAPFIAVAMYGASIGNTSISTIDACVNQACCVLSSQTFSLKYLYYIIMACKPHFIYQGEGGGQPNISQEKIKQTRIPVPCPIEQDKIADYLDAKCAEIDKVVEKTRETIEEYRKLKQSIITETVTKGLNPDAEMKDSGIPWIGKIPVECKTSRIKYLPELRQENNFVDGDWIESPDLVDSGIRYLTTGNIGDGNFKRQGDGYVTEETFYRLHCKFAYPGDLVIARLNAPFGRACLLPDDFEKYVLAVDIVILRPRESRKFLCYVTQCSGYQIAVEDKARGTTMRRISRINLGNIYVPIPPASEQRRIANYLDAKCAELDNIIEKKEQLIEELGSYKKSLIYEYVTGKKEVQA